MCCNCTRKDEKRTRKPSILKTLSGKFRKGFIAVTDHLQGTPTRQSTYSTLSS